MDQTSGAGHDIPAVKALTDRDISSIDSGEYEAVFAALGRAQVLQEAVVSLVEEEIQKRCRSGVRLNQDYVIEMCALLDCVRSLGRNIAPGVSNVRRDLIVDYRQDERVRRMSLLAYSAAALPSEQVVLFLTNLFQSPPPNFIVELAQSLGAFAKNCRQSVEYVMACVESMSGLRDAATSLHARLSKRPVSAENEFTVTELRDGIHDISQIIVTFEEFINPASSQRDGYDTAPANRALSA